MDAKLENAGLEMRTLDYTSIPCLVAVDREARLPPASTDVNNIKDYYILDAGSVMATEALNVQADDRVLDLCAAPGGKTVSILQRLGPEGSLTVNEVSPDRLRRLRRVVEEYAPQSLRNGRVNVVGRDGTKWNEFLKYDKVLVDAPCSSERHLLHDKKEFQLWTAKRTSNNALRQFQLLAAAVQAAKVGGLILYGTCSISSQENDNVVARLLQKTKVPVEVVAQSFTVGEKTSHGWIILPDVADGWGPLYFAVIRRTGIEKRD
jgi:16S rRNA C967 or C1407 C5-methylase (RsmB/RsmF family)